MLPKIKGTIFRGIENIALFQVIESGIENPLKSDGCTRVVPEGFHRSHVFVL